MTAAHVARPALVLLARYRGFRAQRWRDLRADPAPLPFYLAMRGPDCFSDWQGGRADAVERRSRRAPDSWPRMTALKSVLGIPSSWAA
eukprot:4318163-Pyramimonas_sp.AAC.1